MAKRGRPRKNVKTEEENPHGTVVLEQLEEGSPVTTVDWLTEHKENITSRSFTEDPNDKSQTVNIAISDTKYSTKYSRDEGGLLKSVDYKFNEDGSVNWRAMVDSKYLFPNKSWFEARNKPTPRSVDGLQDNQLLIKLAGIKELAKLRGYSSVRYNVIKCEKDHVAIKCEISWVPNFENPSQESDFLPASTQFEDVANATTENTSSFATKFLETIAANRAFVRCVRNFLNVHIVGDDEIDKSNGLPQHPEADEVEPLKKLTPNGVLEGLALSKLKCSSFNNFKDKLRELWTLELYRNDNAKNWESYDDVPAKEARLLINIIKNNN
jgi:hypothetical protein|tara:strand:- start:647 stop:1621 length:975 start_codon:yes stop_codon:yes gene_type:complete